MYKNTHTLAITLFLCCTQSMGKHNYGHQFGTWLELAFELMFSVMKSNTTSNCGKEVLQYGIAKPYWMEEGIYMTKTQSYHIS